MMIVLSVCVDYHLVVRRRRLLSSSLVHISKFWTCFIFTIVSPRDGVGIVFRIDIMGGSFSLWLRNGWTLEAADWVFPTVLLL
jgi:hypothetical protein